MALAEAAWAAVPPGDRENATKYRETIAAALSELAGEADSRSVGPKAGSDHDLTEGTPGPAESSPGAKPASEATGKEAAGKEVAAGKEETAVKTTSKEGGQTTPKKAKPGEAEPDGRAEGPGAPRARSRLLH